MAGYCCLGCTGISGLQIGATVTCTCTGCGLGPTSTAPGRTISPTASPSKPSAGKNHSGGGGGGSDAGLIAGVVVGSIAAPLAVYGALLLARRRRAAGSAGSAEGWPSNYKNFDNPAATDIPEHVHADCSGGGGAGAGVVAKDEGECDDQAEDGEQDTGENGGIASFA